MASTSRQQINRLGSSSPPAPLPPIPKIPIELRQKNPTYAKAWDEYDRQWEIFFEALRKSGSI